jgi:hypothetical protein
MKNEPIKLANAAQLARALHVTPQSVSRWLRAGIIQPDASNIAGDALFLETSIPMIRKTVRPTTN